MPRGQLALFFEGLQCEGRGRKRQRKSGQERFREGQPGSRGQPKDQAREQNAGHDELDEAYAKDRAPHLPKALRPQLQADQKQEHGDA